LEDFAGKSFFSPEIGLRRRMALTVGLGDYRYEPLVDWLKLPAGWAVGDGVGLAAGPDDRIYLIHRGDHPLIVLNREGDVVDSWGDGLFGRTHSVRIDHDGMVYCVDDGNHAILKFTPKGELLLTLGTPGKPSDTGAVGVDYRTIKRAAGPFNRVTDIAFGERGELFVSDGYGNARIHHFSRDGELLNSWGSPGNGPGQFHIPHGIAIDRAGRVLVADRENNRIQIFKQDGQFVAEWSDANRPSTLFVDDRGNVFVGEMGYNRASMYDDGVIPGGRVLYPRVTIRTPDGKILSSWGGTEKCAPGNFWAPHSICVDSHGDLYVGEVTKTTGAPPGCHPIQKFVKK
jgi:sugar lactone lactonase YvrE